MTKYDIYFHGNCFDGLASAAVLTNFLYSRGDSVKKYIPIYHDAFYKISASKSKNPIAIVDFLYHPKAEIYFDHHPTTFLNKRLKKQFKKGAMRVLDFKRPSCAGLIAHYIWKRFGYVFSKHIKELAQWADRIDRLDIAYFDSPKKFYDFKSPAMRIAFSLSEDDSAAYQKMLIETLSREGINATAKLSKLKPLVKQFQKKFTSSMKYVKKNLIIKKKVVFLDNSEKNLVGFKFMVYHFYPKVRYGSNVSSHGKTYHLNVGYNPWNSGKNRINLGNLVRKLFGGGGHKYVGGANFKSKNAAIKAAEKVMEYLEING